MTNDRESIWSVARGALKYYFALFIPQVLLGLALATSLTVRQSDAENFLELWFAVWVSAAPFIVTAAGVSVTLTEIGRFVMVLAAWLQEHLEKARERRREEGRKEGRREGRKEGELYTCVPKVDSPRCLWYTLPVKGKAGA